ncbi:MAG: NAD-dependent malic enzyme [Gammaproteobacteria bacterium]
MLDFHYQVDKNGTKTIATSLHGKPLLFVPQLNKGTAFTEEERVTFHLLGKLPHRIETLEEQVTRIYQQYNAIKGNLQKNIFLNNLHDTNQVLFYKLVSTHLVEMLPTIYTPIVGRAVKQFSQEFRQPRGIYLSYPNRHQMKTILANRSNPEVDIIVVTDGEGVLGIGDQGVGAMDIPIAKLMVYTLCGGIDPTRTLPIQLDVGTNNQTLLDDPLYLGWRHPRITGKEYDDFIREFVKTIKETFPHAFLHWEDFGRNNARRILKACREKLCTFNDDMQGTAVITLAAILAGVKASNTRLTDQRVVIFGAGTAGTGIADQICSAMEQAGLSQKEAQQRFWLLDRPGLLTDDMEDITHFQRPYVHNRVSLTHWNLQDEHTIQLIDVIRHVKPTILIGCSAVANAFNEEVIKTLCQYTPRPIILPLSNPTERCEAHPADLLHWSDGKALIATGSPFKPVDYKGQKVTIAQCNNALAFPGIGLGVTLTQATYLSDTALWEAAQQISDAAPVLTAHLAPLLPTIEDAPMIAQKVAESVGKSIVKEGHGILPPAGNWKEAIKQTQWSPHYLPLTLKK